MNSKLELLRLKMHGKWHAFLLCEIHILWENASVDVNIYRLKIVKFTTKVLDVAENFC